MTKPTMKMKQKIFLSSETTSVISYMHAMGMVGEAASNPYGAEAAP